MTDDKTTFELTSHPCHYFVCANRACYFAVINMSLDSSSIVLHRSNQNSINKISSLVSGFSVYFLIEQAKVNKGRT